MNILIVLFICAVIYVAYAGLKGIVPNREYKSGTGWCFWRWTKTDSEYILRLHVVKTPWFAICLHWIQKPDAEPWLHDHPVSFFSVILRGGYTELRRKGDGKPYHKVNRRFNFVRGSHEDAHRIILVRRNTLTLCFMGPKTREWGFHVWREMCPPNTATPGWIMWKEYYRRLRAGEDMRPSGLIVLEAVAEGAAKLVGRFSETHTGKTRDDDVRMVDGAFAVSREDFYKNVQIEFGDEDPTWPRK